MVAAVAAIAQGIVPATCTTNAGLSTIAVQGTTTAAGTTAEGTTAAGTTAVGAGA